ncbi:MAG: hydroxymyristoyl-ACP dehydratase [Ideonella sp.]
MTLLEVPTANQPATLDHMGIAAMVPHSGRMCLLERMCHWSADAIHCSAISHRDAANPLRSPAGLLAPCAVEYAAQAMALHGRLVARRSGPPQGGYIAAVRGVQWVVPFLHDIAGDLQIHAERLAGDGQVVSYHFHVDDVTGRRLAEGRATVVLEPAESAR